MLVREYMSGDEQEILKLFNVVFGRKLDEEFWRWRFLKTPFGKSVIWLMFDNQKLVGHYAAVPVPLWLDNRIIESAMIMTVMTHPDYRGMRICTNLANEVYDSCRARGLKIVFGFPNNNIYRLYLEQLNWIGFGRMDYWEKEDLVWQKAENKHEYEVEEISRFDTRFDELWEKLKSDNGIAVPRISKYLNWRYCEKPGKEYRIYSAKDNQSLVCGFVVIKLYKENGEVTGHLIDALVIDNSQAHWSLLTATLDYFEKEGASIITCWFPDNSLISGVLRKTGFERKSWPTYFGARILALEKREASLVSEMKNWWITMGDSDVF